MTKNYGAKLEAVCTITHPRRKTFYGKRVNGKLTRRTNSLSLWGLRRGTYELLNKLGWVKGLVYRVNGFNCALREISTGDGGSARFEVIR